MSVTTGGGDTRPVTIVSLDSHAQVPQAAWKTYLEKPYHDLLSRLSKENQQWIDVMGRLMIDRTHLETDVFDPDRVYDCGLLGMFDCETRLAQMDREGIAGEFVYNGEPRQVALFFQPSNSKYSDEACEAGVRAHHRWAYEEFGQAGDRVLLIGVTGHAPCRDLEATLSEIRWISEHGFVGTVAPGMTSYLDQPPLYDEYWDPMWKLCAERELTVVVHAGYGTEAGPFFKEIADVHSEMQIAGDLTDELLTRFTTSAMTANFFNSVDTRRPLWQLTLGGVFDRHPDLKLLLTEIRADWLPAMLRHLDAIFEQHRRDLPTRSKPSEHWQRVGTTCVSFAHRAEIEMRDEIGVDTMAFGRDYPHPEGTWPNTRQWIHNAFLGVPESDLRSILGENAIRRLGLDGAVLEAVAGRIGPTVEELRSGELSASPALLQHFDARGGYLKPAEGGRRLGEANESIRHDLGQLASAYRR
jgi:predicted TIM-barrel fold metal-dependent hydrolase